MHKRNVASKAIPYIKSQTFFRMRKAFSKFLNYALFQLLSFKNNRPRVFYNSNVKNILFRNRIKPDAD